MFALGLIAGIWATRRSAYGALFRAQDDVLFYRERNLELLRQLADLTDAEPGSDA
jgi:hypothetical protein